MSIEKLSDGMLRVLTPLGPRYLKPSFSQRIYLLWLFRNFPTLPVKVLNARQLRWIDVICAEHHFLSFPHNRLGDIVILGTLEQAPAADAANLPPRRPSARVTDAVAPFAADAQQRS
jgi:hypothetical protein